MARRRLDALLVERGLAPTREKAKALVMAGLVQVDGRRADKPGTAVEMEAALEVLEGGCPYVGRGGLKLEGALGPLGVDPEGRTALDIGASTGGFTDLLLRRGAACVVAVDVGYGQLDWSLRNDPRVRVLERVNARHLTLDHLPDGLPAPADLAVVDVSFISLEKVLPAVLDCLAPPADVVSLVKPQFEAGPEQVGKGGVVRDPEVRRRVLLRLIEWIDQRGLALRGLVPSPLPGASGNREFFAWLGPGGGGMDRREAAERVSAVVEATREG
jgi:23S rRNA (cytidine1920-2'-O)/16S rRNA (cytidine1409-2'-O)-methyltransferase